jgi:hypothetical protein
VPAPQGKIIHSTLDTIGNTDDAWTTGVADMLYRLAAVPALHSDTADIIIVDQRDTFYLLDGSRRSLVQLNRTDVRAAMTFFEPSCASSWHRIEHFFTDSASDGISTT